MGAIRFVPRLTDEWNKCVDASTNGTFLFKRPYMDYHKDRFYDCSLLFVKRGKPIGLLPANICGDEVYSHQGLTYGGLVYGPKVYVEDVGEMLRLLILYYRNELGVKVIHYKPVPDDYLLQPASEPLFCLSQMGAQLERRQLASVVNLRHRIPYSELRRRHLAKAKRSQLHLAWGEIEADWTDFWQVLTDILWERHKSRPVHSLSEIMLLHSRFPSEIRLLTIRQGDVLLGGTVLYITPRVIHTQYIAASDRGCELGALEMLFDSLMHSALSQEHDYLDFGTSHHSDGSLNEGLCFQKQGLGGRGICYDQYKLSLT